MRLTVVGEIREWRGPAPYHFVTIEGEGADAIESVASQVSYGWGVIPVRVTVGSTTWSTSLFPKDGTYLIPIKDRIRKAENLALGDIVTAEVEV